MGINGVGSSHRGKWIAGAATLAVVIAPILVAASSTAASTPAKLTAASPTSVTAVAGSGQVRVSWLAPASPGFVIGEYYLTYSADGGTTWGHGKYTGTRVTTILYTGLTNGRNYVFRVRAENSSTSGSWSSPSNVAVPLAGLPVPVATIPPSPSGSPSGSVPGSSAPVASGSPTLSLSASSPPAATFSPTPTLTPLATVTPTATPTVTYTGAPPASGWWRPTLGTTWQRQLAGTIDASVAVPVFDIDGQDNSAATVAGLHSKGAHVICYIDAGGWENYRPDAASFPAVVLGNTMNGWPDERWLDIRALTILLPIMEKRIADCKAKGFDALEADVVDGYTNNTGFPLTAANQIAYNSALADLAHKYGLGVALKNDPEQAAALAPKFDFAIVEECYQYGECSSYSPFVAAGKAVLEVEYQGTTASFCPTMIALGFSSMKKNLALDAPRQACS